MVIGCVGMFLNLCRCESMAVTRALVGSRCVYGYGKRVLGLYLGVTPRRAGRDEVSGDVEGEF